MIMATIDEIYPCKKPRRSLRLEEKGKEVHAYPRQENNGPLGYFKLLPVEIQFHIFSLLKLEELSVLTITSKELRNVVELYRTAPCAQKFMVPMHIQHSKKVAPLDMVSYLTQFKKLGLLMKRSTCLYATRDRLRFVIQCLQKYLCNAHTCNSPADCISLRCFGKFLHTVIAGWDDKECVKMFEAVITSTFMDKYLESVLQNKPGKNLHLELHVRLFFRRVFIDQCSNNNDKAFWIQQILKHFPMVLQARVLFLLFGPIFDNEIQWYEMSETTLASAEQARQCFGDLAHAFIVLYEHIDSWNEDDTISVMEELTSFPEEWLAENMASLLYLCGDAITIKVLHSKAINGRLMELATIITSLSLVCIRHRQSMDWVMNVVSHVSEVFDNSKQRVNFIYAIIDMFKEMILEIHEYDDDTPDYLQHMMEAQAAFSKHLALRAITGDIIIKTKYPPVSSRSYHPTFHPTLKEQ